MKAKTKAETKAETIIEQFTSVLTHGENGNYLNPILLKLFRAIDSLTAGLQKPTNLTIYNSKTT